MGLIFDIKVFEFIIDDYFKILDLDGDGMLLLLEFWKGLNCVVVVELEVVLGEEIDSVYEVIFERFGENLVLGKFRDLIFEIMMVMVRVFGNMLVIMVVYSDGLIMKVVCYELENVM